MGIDQGESTVVFVVVLLAVERGGEGKRESRKRRVRPPPGMNGEVVDSLVSLLL